ncbi:MAG: hypothetical protein ACOYLO_15230, partial [Ferruginibacter sp.]
SLYILITTKTNPMAVQMASYLKSVINHIFFYHRPKKGKGKAFHEKRQRRHRPQKSETNE